MGEQLPPVQSERPSPDLSHTTGKGLIHIEVESKSWIDQHVGTEVITRSGISTPTSLTYIFTILYDIWALLNVKKPGSNLVEEVTEDCLTQEGL
jgi:hypothetical protein